MQWLEEVDCCWLLLGLDWEQKVCDRACVTLCSHGRRPRPGHTATHLSACQSCCCHQLRARTDFLIVAALKPVLVRPTALLQAVKQALHRAIEAAAANATLAQSLVGLLARLVQSGEVSPAQLSKVREPFWA